MRTFILIGRSRETGKDVLICDRTAPVREQLDKRKGLAQSRVNDEFSDALLVEVLPAKSKLKFITTDADKAEKQRVADALKAKEAAKVEAQESVPAAPDAGVPPTVPNDNQKNKRKNK